MFDYLYYKLYQATLKGSLGDIPQFITPFFFAGLISVNLLVINALLAKMDIMPFFFSNKKQAGVLFAVLIVLTYFYYSRARSNRLMERYITESKASRIKGNIIVSVYVAFSFLSIFAVAFFRPGKL